MLLFELAGHYYKFLTSIDWNDDLYVKGNREGIRKFLSNMYLAMLPTTKYYSADYYSEAAKQILDQSTDRRKGLIFEHMVPKHKYIQGPCEEAARSGTLTQGYIHNLLASYWKIAIITEEEDKLLLRTSMPKKWNGSNIFARYDLAKISLHLAKD